jgi:hypothetical protein
MSDEQFKNDAFFYMLSKTNPDRHPFLVLRVRLKGLFILAMACAAVYYSWHRPDKDVVDAIIMVFELLFCLWGAFMFLNPRAWFADGDAV